MHDLRLPTHPTKRHPKTGQPLQAIWVRPDGRVMWPILGAAPDDGEGGDQGGTGGTGSGDTGGAAGAGGAGAGAAAGAGGRTPATDAQGNDLGFPKDTPTAEMSDKEQAAYWRHNARKHEGLWKGVAGDRKLEDVQNDLNELAEIRRSQQTPAEQALATRFDEGKAAGLAAARTETATTVFRTHLEAAGVSKEDADDLVANFNVANFVTDSGVETTKISNFAKRFTPAGTGGQQRERDFGAGRRREGQPTRGAGGKAEAERRFPKKTS